ncbi:penicillin-binding protein 2B [Lentibacillus halodurans]|uniref:serine-type D-Ala-D-Ala carboxypeptidase n=1 Tax=Lentibacillus halodurans TaxID=237679 RepID=A0A1I0Z3Q6_9BACI|nr:penicillin-binding protein [Lentibacillus halodurans]SFB18903.1 penicillin-binding protein 2B [Lentibacillus halodurans]
MKKNKKTHFMSGILIVLFVGIFLLVSGRFLYIQATGEIDGVSLKKLAEEKRTASYTLGAERGKIYDRNGMTLAYDRPTYRIQAIIEESYTQDEEEPMHVDNPEETAEMLAPLLDADEAYLLEQLKEGIQEDQFQVEFGNAGKELSQETKEKIEELDIPGIEFVEEPIRYYPNGMFASQIIGFAQKEDDVINGVAGIENEMNKLLSGKDGHISYERDHYNTKLLNPNEVIKQPENGEDVYLTIDQKVQTLLEDAMTQMDNEYNPERMTAIVMNPKTGEVLAMSNRPSYNPNNPEDVQNWYNDAIATPVAPGSTMKLFTWSAAIEEGVYNGDEWFESGTYKISDRVEAVRDHNGGEGWGSITYDEGFARSSNVAAAKLVWEKIGTEEFLDYWNAFDFDEKTGIDLPGEEAGQLVYNYPRDKISTAFGQASILTPIQQMKAATAIANGGKMVKPYVISKTVDPTTGQTLDEKSTEVVSEPISKETSEQMRDLMESVVSSEHGTGNEYKLDDYSVAGKTGTAQIYENGKRLTGHGNNTFSFLGIAPKEDPELMMYVSVKQPDIDVDETGSEPISFIFKNVMQNSLHYLDIEPDKETSDQIQPVKLPEIIDQKTSEVKNKLTDSGLNVAVVGSGNTIEKASAVKGDELLAGDRIILVTDKPKMPDITGWSLRDVLQLADLTELDLEPIGNGYAVTQSIKEGKTIKKNDYLGVEFEPPATDTEETEESNDTSES